MYCNFKYMILLIDSKTIRCLYLFVDFYPHRITLAPQA